ncbi:hypothetical protein IGI49_001129 [Enterococcus sp. AZ071]
MTLYDIVITSLPFIEKTSGWLAIFLFVLWIYKMKSISYRARIQIKARNKIKELEKKNREYNFLNPGYETRIKTSWLDYQKFLLAKRNNTLLLSVMLAYVSFNSMSFYRNNNEDFFKLLTISTTLFLAGITYIRQQYRE